VKFRSWLLPRRIVQMQQEPSPAELARRQAWFEEYTAQENVTAPLGGGPYACPCCQFLTLAERGGYDICPVCFWEDDGQDEHDADKVRGGPNSSLSLRRARENYLTFGACERRVLQHVRAPLPDERPRSE
jgi:hypothetical protein